MKFDLDGVPICQMLSGWLLLIVIRGAEASKSVVSRGWAAIVKERKAQIEVISFFIFEEVLLVKLKRNTASVYFILISRKDTC